MNRRHLSLVFVLLLGASSAAADSLVIRDSTVHVGDGSTVLQVTDVLVEDGRISAVGRNLAAPANAREVQGRGLHLTPGLTAPSTNLGLVEIGAVRSTRDAREVGDLNPHVNAWIAFNPDSELIGVARANGVLHALVAPQGGKVPGRSALLELEGWTHEDMSIAKPAALHVNWPSYRINRGKDAKPGVAEQERKRDDAVEAIEDLFARARAYQLSAAERAGGQLPPGERAPRLEAMQPALDGEIPVVVSANDVAQMRAAIDWAKAQGLRLVLSGARDAWRMADEIAAADVPVIIGGVRAMPRRDHEPYDSAFTNPVALHEAGVRFCFNVGGAANLRNLPDEAAMALAYGLPAEAALAGITSAPAEVFGVADEIGRVAVGLRGNLVLWDGPPLEITSRVERLFLGGEELAQDDRHSRLYEKYRARPRER